MKKLNKSVLIYTILIIVVGWLIYYPSLHNKFIWDDEAQIVNNPFIRSLENIPAILTGGTFYLKAAGDNLQGVYYRPMMTLTYTAIYHFFGLNPLPFHAIQLIIHIANTLLLFTLFLRLIKWRSRLLPFLLSLLFLIHPMNSETVSYIANIQDVLMFFFGILSLHAIIGNKRTFLNFLASIGLMFLSLVSKETAIVFMAITLLYSYLYQKKYFIVHLILEIGLLALYTFIRCGIAHICVSAYKPNPIGELPFLSFLLQIPSLAFYYIKTFILPTNLAIGQSWVITHVNWTTFYLPFFALLLLAIFFLFFLFKLYIQKNPYKKLYVFFLCWFAFGLSFHLHAIPLDFTVADRWFYIPMAGLIGLTGLLINIYVSDQLRMRIVTGVICVVLIFFSILTYRRNFDWHDNYTLFSRDLKKSDRSFHMENNLGVMLYRDKKYDEALVHFENALRYAPDWPSALTNTAVVYRRKKQYKKAEALYLKAINNGAFYKTYEDYISLLEEQGKKEVAMLFIKRVALKKFPKNTDLLKIYNRLINENTN